MVKSLIVAIWRTNRTFPLIMAALLVANILLFLGLSRMYSPRVEELERRYLAAQGEAHEAALRRERMATPQGRFQKNQEDLQTFRAAIPPRGEFSELVREIFSLADGAGLVIERVSYEPQAEGNLLRYSLSFSVTGDYGQIKKFIHSLEQSPRMIAIEELALSGKEAAEGGGVSLRVRLATYFKSQAS